MSVTYAPTTRQCTDAVPSFRGDVVRPDALEMHASCPGTCPVKGQAWYDGKPCHCECHTPEGLPDWKKPQEGEALGQAIALRRKIGEDTEYLRRAYPVLPAGRLTDVAQWISEQEAT